MTIDLSHMAPADGVAALKSFPRRYRSALVGPDPDEAEELAARIGPEGRSALDLVSDATRTWHLVERALHQALLEEDPVVRSAVLDPTQRQWDQPAEESLPAALAQLTDAADDLVKTAGLAGFSGWERTARLAGDDVADARTVTALDLLKEAVRTGSDNLRAIDTVLAAVRR